MVVMATGQSWTCTLTEVMVEAPVAVDPFPTQPRARVRGANAPAVFNRAFSLIVTKASVGEGRRPSRPPRLVIRALF
jgi:hypothetical protein